MNDLLMIWDEVVSMMDVQLNSLQVKTWIGPLKPISLSDGHLILDATSSFIRGMVQKKYLDSLQECMSYLCKQPISVELIDPSQSDYYLILKKTMIEDNGQVSWNSREAGAEHFPEQGSFEEEFFSSTSMFHQIEERKSKNESLRRQNGYDTLNPKYTMESFVVGPSNEFAVAAAKAVISNPGMSYNPLFIYGGSGLGKTHLMQAIAHQILVHDPHKKVLYITSEKFMNEMIAMIENGTNAEKEKFRQKYRSIDVLLIDDIQFIAGKKATMEEMFHTFNDLKEANKQIVLSSDKPPKELRNLEERLVTRFEGGMTADIQQPDFETRVAIINHKLRSEHLEIPSYVSKFIANHITSNIRELEGALLKVSAFFRYKSIDPMTAPQNQVLEQTRAALKLQEQQETVITMESIMNLITEHYDLEKGALTSKSRQSSVVLPRQIAMYLCRKLTNLSLKNIGHGFERDHTTAIHAIDKIEASIKEDDQFKKEIDELIQELRNR